VAGTDAAVKDITAWEIHKNCLARRRRGGDHLSIIKRGVRTFQSTSLGRAAKCPLTHAKLEARRKRKRADGI
jgi:hypothetical protein